MNFNSPGSPGPTYSTLRKVRPLSVLLIASLASCSGSGDNGSSTTSMSDLTNSPIAGSWITLCDGSSGALSLKDTLEFNTDGTFARTVSGYFDLACTVAAFDTATTGTVQESNAYELPERGIVRNVNFITNSYSIIPRSEESALFFNGQSICGISNWEVGVKFDISSCSNRPGDDVSRRPTPYTDYSIYLVEKRTAILRK